MRTPQTEYAEKQLWESAAMPEKSPSQDSFRPAFILVGITGLAALAFMASRSGECRSVFTGAHQGVVAEVKSMLNDPDSFQHVSTDVTPPDSLGVRFITMTYRARNGFGAIITRSVNATTTGDSCRAQIISMQ